MSATKDMCVYMIGSFSSSSSSKPPEAYICASPYPKHHVNKLNAQSGTVRSKRNATSNSMHHWRLCVVLVVPVARRIDIEALKIFWQMRSRKLPNRIRFGVKLANALQLRCYVEREYIEQMRTIPFKQRTLDINTLVGTPICHTNEVVSFTLGSASANELTRKAEHRSVPDLPELDVVPEVDWENLAQLIVDDPAAPLDILSQTIQANTLELMLHARDPTQRASAQHIVDTVKSLAMQGPLTKIDTGVQPFEQLRDSIKATCVDDNGDINDVLLVRNGDTCYDDVVEYRDRPLSSLRLTRLKMCTCGTQNALSTRVRVVTDAGAKVTYRCDACQRLASTSVLLQPSVSALRDTIGEHSTNSTSTMLQCYKENSLVPSASLDTEPVAHAQEKGSSVDLVDRLLGQKRKR